MNAALENMSEAGESPGTADAEVSAAPPTARQYGDVAAIYDALMAGVPHNAWLRRIERAAKQRGITPQSALDVACGTGIVTGLLYRRGLRPVVGVDISSAMISIARTRALSHNEPIPFFVQDAAELDLHGERVDLAVSLFDSLNYIIEPERLRLAFKRVYEHLNPHAGLFAFDLNAMYALAHDMFSQKVDYGPVRHDWQAYWNRETRLCRVEMDFLVTDDETGEERHFHETHLQRAYTVPEITEWLADAGFIRIECFGNYGNRPPSARSDRLLFVAERR